MATKTTAPPKGGPTIKEPVHETGTVLAARKLAETVYLEWAAVRELETGWTLANSQVGEAARAITGTGESIPDDCTGTYLRELLVRCRTNREQRDRCRTAFDDVNKRLIDSARAFMARKKELSDMGVALAMLPPDDVLMNKALVERGCAVAILVRQVGECAFKTDYLQVMEERQKALPKKPAQKKRSPARESFQQLFDALTAQLEHAIKTYERTLGVKTEAQAAVDAIAAIDEEAIVEPMKPTAEEVGRYIFEVDKRSRLQIPAQRMAAIAVLKFRRQMVALYDAYRDLVPPLRKMGYLEAYEIEVEVEALIVAARKVSEFLRQRHLAWMRLVDRWCSMEFDTSTPVEEQPLEELEIIELLEAQIRNLGVAVANKSIAGTKFRSMNITAKKELPTAPSFSYSDLSKLEDDYAKAANYLSEFAQTAAANELAEAKTAMASDAFDARQELARRLSAKLAHTVGVIGNTLKKPMSDQLRVMFFGVRLLHRLNGGPAANAKG